jgi:hypothetical protein
MCISNKLIIGSIFDHSGILLEIHIETLIPGIVTKQPVKSILL